MLVELWCDKFRDGDRERDHIVFHQGLNAVIGSDDARNSIGKTNSVQASLVAWAATFGRHLIPRAPREQVYLVRKEGRRTTLIPVQGRRDGADFAGAMLRRGTEILTKAR